MRGKMRYYMNGEADCRSKISFWLRELPASASLMVASEGEWQKIKAVSDRVLRSDENIFW
jgi:hypothetical protein